MHFTRVSSLLCPQVISGFLVFIAAIPIGFAQRDVPDRAHVEEVLRGLNRGRSVGQVAVSPDGKQLAWVEGGRGGGDIRVAPLENLSKSTRVTAATKADERCSEGDVAWAPDSKAIAFFSECGSGGGQENLYIGRLDGTARRVTELKGYVHEPAFSPDGSKVGFLYVEGATRAAGALAAMKLPSGVIGEDGVEIQRVALAAELRVRRRLPMMATPANLHAYEFDWAPDSKGFAYVAADPPGENNWWVAKLYTQALGGEAKAVLAPAEVAGPLHGLQIAVPRWSPDGKTIAFIGGLMSDQGSTGGDVWIVSADGGTAARSDRGEADLAGVDGVERQRVSVCERTGGGKQSADPAASARRSRTAMGR